MTSSLKIKITGINGYLGKAISERLTRNGHTVSGIKRDHLYGNADVLKTIIQGCDVIINLAGETILQRWNASNMVTIYNSRIVTTRNLVKAVNLLSPELRPLKFINASAIGIYKNGLCHDETSTQFDEGFLGNVVKDWEGELRNLPESVQTIVFRLGLVIGKNSKLIKSQILPFKMGIGAKIGIGNQAFPFVHESDVAKAFVWATEELKGSNLFNLVAPERITNAGFTKIFAKKLHRNAFFKIPEFVIKMILGNASVLLLESPEVIARRLPELDFKFQYNDLSSAMDEILS